MDNLESLDNSTNIVNLTTEKDVDSMNDLKLWNLNLHMLRVYIPVSVMVLFLLILGITGNCLVIYVYHVHFKKTTANLFIKVLAVLDVACCIFGMSYELVDLCFSVLNGEKISCKLFRGLEQSLEFITGECLLCIAWDRYLHVCKPLAIFTIQRAKQLVLACVVIGVLVSSPTLLLIGPADVYIDGIKTQQCTFDENYENSNVKYVYYICLNAFTGITFITMIALYIRIWCKLHRWQRSHIGESMRPAARRFVHSEVVKRFQEVSSIEMSASEKVMTTRALSISFTKESCIVSSSKDKHLSDSVNYQTGLDKLKRKRLVKPVMILFFVTLVFVLSFLPYFCLMLLHSVGIVQPNALSVGHRQVWEMAYKSYFLSNALNPLIYAAFDNNFRSICFNVLFIKGYRRKV